MRIRNLLLLVILGVLVIFAAINWAAIVTPTAISLLFTSIEAPLGLVLLSITALLVVIFLGFVVQMQASIMTDRRRLMIDLNDQRELANQAEASRFTDLQTFLQAELEKLATQNQAVRNGLELQLNTLEQKLSTTIEQSANSLSAYIGELEDRLENKRSQNL